MAFAIAGGDAPRLTGDDAYVVGDPVINERDRGHDHRRRRHRLADGDVVAGQRPALIHSSQVLDPSCLARPLRTRQRLGVGVGGLAGPPSRIGAATELAGVTAPCLRGATSQAPERPAASGWPGCGAGLVGCTGH